MKETKDDSDYKQAVIDTEVRNEREKWLSALVANIDGFPLPDVREEPASVIHRVVTFLCA